MKAFDGRALLLLILLGAWVAWWIVTKFLDAGETIRRDIDEAMQRHPAGRALPGPRRVVCPRCRELLCVANSARDARLELEAHQLEHETSR